MGRAGRFGTKGLAITFVSSASDSDVLNQVIFLLNTGGIKFSSLIRILISDFTLMFSRFSQGLRWT